MQHPLTTPVPDQVISAVRRLAALPDFKTFLGHLESSLQERDRENRQATEYNLYRSQGASLTLEAILGLVREATEKRKIA